ncbi:hemerythrin domain-containing protein [Cognatishimia sp. WU-CL00825]|uniref:hemerythrin domain-containing protein n=1 Tax=Cognatishimia sp. WU-CL00825 TaxID=3127658 RepID=UPI00310AEC32
MTHYDINVRQGLPQDMQLLLRDYPRDAWPGHPNFARATQNWMRAHQMFRKLAEILEADTKGILDKQTDPERFAARLGHYGNQLIGNLHGHHGWEDHSFFPELQAADDRFERGLEMLESDHVEMDGLLDNLTRNANRYLKLSDLSPKDAENELPAILANTQAIGRFLTRHLADEEDLVVPIILHHKLRG